MPLLRVQKIWTRMYMVRFPCFKMIFIWFWYCWLADTLQFSSTIAPADASVKGAEDSNTSASESPLYSNTPVSEPPPCATSHLTPAGTTVDENPFHNALDIHPLTPIPDSHLQDDGGPSEPISWAFQCQALDNPFEMDPWSSPPGAFGEENSSRPCPISPSPTAINEGHIDPNLLKLSAVGPTLPSIQYPAAHSPMTTRTVTQASNHPLSSLSTARLSFVFDTFLSGGDKGRFGSYLKLWDFTLLFMTLQVELRLNKKDH